MYMYEMAFDIGRLGRASAIAVVVLALVILLVLVNTGLAQLRTRQASLAQDQDHHHDRRHPITTIDAPREAAVPAAPVPRTAAGSAAVSALGSAPTWC